MMPTKTVNMMLCFTVKRNKSDSFPTKPTAAQAMAIDCGEIILPVTPPLVLAATNNTSGIPICCAVVACNAENKAFEEVSEPVRNTPSQPKMARRK